MRVGRDPWSHVLDTRASESQIFGVNEKYALLLIDHGSRRVEANELIERIAEKVRTRTGADHIVAVAHMELAEPTIEAGFARCVEQGATIVVAHPFMLAPGRHVTEDLPRLIAAAAAPHPATKYVIAEPLGAHPGIVEAVVDRCTTALSEDES